MGTEESYNQAAEEYSKSGGFINYGLLLRAFEDGLKLNNENNNIAEQYVQKFLLNIGKKLEQEEFQGIILSKVAKSQSLIEEILERQNQLLLEKIHNKFIGVENILALLIDKLQINESEIDDFRAGEQILSELATQCNTIPLAIMGEITNHDKIPTITLENLYVEQFAHTTKGDLPVLEFIENNKCAVILGEPGSGKTSVLNYLAIEMFRRSEELSSSSDVNLKSDIYFPMRIFLKDLLPLYTKGFPKLKLQPNWLGEELYQGLLDFIEKSLSEYGVPNACINRAAISLPTFVNTANLIPSPNSFKSTYWRHRLDALLGV
ncbi:MAG: hypothetical protein L6Q29_03280 [Candidatus Pacebacteria bacterium]|nr:hypothetical protein [Candidatus Paceibacterota bacterium]